MDMRKFVWLSGGIGAALLVVALVLMGPGRGLLQPPERPTATPAAGAPTGALPTATRIGDPGQQPSATLTPSPASVEWERNGGRLGQCDRLSVNSRGEVYFATCELAPQLAQLTDDELRRYQAYVARHGVVQYDLSDPSDSGLRLTLRLYGEGERAPTTIEKEAIMFWAQTVFERLLAEEQRGTAVAAARAALARSLSVDAEAVQVIAVEEVTWPDACLGIQQAGVFCAQVLTPGFRITLGVGDQRHEYRADWVGLVRAATTATAPTSPATR